MALRALRSISLTIILASVTVTLSIAMLVGWITVLVRSGDLGERVAGNTWLLAAGVLSLVLIMAVQILFGIFLVREIREGHRQTTFIDSVTHELKSPLASLKLCLETLARPGISDEQRQSLREMMVDDVDRLSIFIEDILVSTRLANRPLIDRGVHLVQEVDIGALARRCAETVGRRYHLPPGAIEVEAPEELTLRTDGTALETVLKNLLDNAVKYSDPPPAVRLAVRDHHDRILLEVRDHGIGIPPQHVKRIFDRFYRVPGESVRSRRGTGLGLFVAAALVRSLGGRIEVHSDGPKAVTSFLVRLPAGSERRPSPGAAPVPEAPR